MGELRSTGPEQFLLLLEVSEPIAQCAAVFSFFDGADDADDLSLDGVELLPIRRELLLTFRVGAVYFFLKGSNELTHELRRQKFLLEASEDALLDFLSAHRRVVVAGSFAAMCGAAIAVLRHDGEATAAPVTFEQTGQQEFAPMDAIEGVAALITPDLEGELTLTKPHRLPEIVSNNAELGNLHDLPQILRIWSRHAFPAIRIFDIGTAVPFDSPSIEAVIQNTRASIDLTPDRGVAPLAPVGTRNAFGV